jgi:hypothetical protein
MGVPFNFMGIKLEDLDRAGLVETDGQLERKSNASSTTDVRPSQTKARQTRFQSESAGSAAVLERDSGDGAMGAVQVQARSVRRFHVRVTAIRTRLLDEDNMCEKYHIDLLRYASGGVFGDGPSTTTIEVCQEKAQAGEPEEVRLEVFEI